MLRGGAVALLFASGCYRPSLEAECAVTCDHQAASPACPDGMSCGMDNKCFATTQCDMRPIDAPTTDVGGNCPGLGWLHFCPSTVRAGEANFGDAMFDTDQHCTETIDMGTGVLCVFAAESIKVTGHLSIRGSRPMVFVGMGDVDINNAGRFDVSVGGAGAGDAEHCALVPNGQNGNAPGMAVGGGPGGSLATMGGQGGAPAAGSATVAVAATTPSFLRGGCPGGKGGKIVTSDGEGAGGEGGGAVYVIAGDTLAVRGNILAWGGGGGPGRGAAGTAGGGGGGGSGGVIVLDAPTVMLDTGGKLLAEGGGGGGGGTNNSLATGGGTTSPGTPAPATGGGAASGCSACGAGGRGSFNGAIAMDGLPTTTNGAGAGGGGGGAGYIRVFTQSPNIQGTSYPPAIVP